MALGGSTELTSSSNFLFGIIGLYGPRKSRKLTVIVALRLFLGNGKS